MNAPYVELGLTDIRKLSSSPKHWGWVKAEGYEMYQGGNDDSIALRFFHGHTYEPTTRQIWKKCCARGGIAIDIGSHSGLFTLDAYSSGAKLVISIEPHPVNFARLVMNLRHNNFKPDGAWLGAAGDDEAVRMMLVKSLYKVYAAGRVGLHNPNGMEIPVRVVRVETIVPQVLWPQISAIKVDAENLTPQALKGLGGILKHTPDLIIECTEPGMGAELKALGYKFWQIWEGGDVSEVEDLIPYNPGHNYNGTHENCRNRFASVKGLP